MDLGQEVLDQQVVDRNGTRMGRVDGVVLELRQGHAPRVARLVIGGPTILRRISPALARWVAERRWGSGSRRTTFEVPWARVLKVGIDVKVDADAKTTPAYFWEHWVRERIIKRIPGA